MRVGKGRGDSDEGGGREGRGRRPVRRSLAKKPATRPTAIRAMKRAVVGREGGWEERARGQSCPLLCLLQCCPQGVTARSSNRRPSLPPLFHCSAAAETKLPWVRPSPAFFLLDSVFAKLSSHITHFVTHFSTCCWRTFRRISLILSFEQRLPSLLTHIQFI